MDHLLRFLHEWRQIKPDSKVWGTAPFNTIGSLFDKMTLGELRAFNKGRRFNPRTMRWI